MWKRWIIKRERTFKKSYLEKLIEWNLKTGINIIIKIIRIRILLK